MVNGPVPFVLTESWVAFPLTMLFGFADALALVGAVQGCTVTVTALLLTRPHELLTST